MNETLLNKIAEELMTYLKMSCATPWTAEDIARFLRMEYPQIAIGKESMTPISPRLRPDAFWYAAIIRHADNPSDFQVLEYFGTKAECFAFVAEQRRKGVRGIEPAKFE